MERDKLIKEILDLKESKNAVIVAHNYQNDEVQEIADVVGDSLYLSEYCNDIGKETIVFCGVHFMAESAKILSPNKTVLLPEIDAGCPMADMINKDLLIEEKKKYPGYKVVCYINSTAEVKAESDICCTSSNAVEIVKSIEEKNILFVPDKNLGNYVASKVPEKNIVSWDGYCITHHKIKVEEILEIKKLHNDAKLLIHPECTKEALEYADFIGSTKQIIDYAKKSSSTKFIIGTEMGIMYKLKRDNPSKEFYVMSKGLICPNMKKTTLKSVYEALKDNKNKIEIDENIRVRAKKSLFKMLELKNL